MMTSNEIEVLKQINITDVIRRLWELRVDISQEEHSAAFVVYNNPTSFRTMEHAVKVFTMKHVGEHWTGFKVTLRF